jgi:branched-chain amino acid transport system ATP-binding protein
MMPLLQVQHLSKAFGGNQAVNDVSFNVQAGEMLALIGPNGAGKSTTFHLINGQLLPDAGEVLLNGASILGQTPHALSCMGVSRTFQVAQTFASLTVLENVQLALLSADGLGFSLWRKATQYRNADAMHLLAQVQLDTQAQRPCHALAYGDIKRLELAMSLANQPRLLLMDEPTAGMSPQERHALMALTRELVRTQGVSVLFTEHSMDVVFEHAHRILVMARGSLMAQGDPQSIAQHPDVKAVYFGRGTRGARRAVSADDADDGEGVSSASNPVSPPLLEVSQLNAWYGPAQVLFDVGLHVQAGEVLALIGPNGAGKSSVLKAIMGLMPRRTGSVLLQGQNISHASAHQAARLGLGYVPEDRRIFTDLTVLENLTLAVQAPKHFASGVAAPVWSLDKVFALFPNLAGMQHRLASHMSGGEQQMLTVARTLMGNPLLVLLDEPSEGVAPVIVDQMADMVMALKAQGVGVLLSEQNSAFAEAISDRSYLLAQGVLTRDL